MALLSTICSTEPPPSRRDGPDEDRRSPQAAHATASSMHRAGLSTVSPSEVFAALRSTSPNRTVPRTRPTGRTTAPSPPLVDRHHRSRKEGIMGIGIGGLVVIIILIVIFVL
jgi:hypothetical protein